MNKKICDSTFIMLCIIIACYSCNKDSYKTVVYKDLSKDFIDTVAYPIQNDKVVKINLILRGHINGMAKLEIGNHIGRYFEEFIVSGDVDTTYEAEWYENTYLLKYTPITNVNGDSLIIKYCLW